MIGLIDNDIGNNLNNLKKPSKTGRNVGFKDILISCRKQFKILIFTKLRGECFRNTIRNIMVTGMRRYRV